VMATVFDGSRPILTSPSGNGIVESFSGPQTARSLGCKIPSLCPVLFLSQLDAKFISQVELFQYPNR
jgi:hypothetical protein